MSGASDAQRFYGRWAALYDLLARHSPRVASVRERAVAHLDLSPGDVVVDVGCGTGATVPHLRRQVGREGRIVGVDFTPEMLTRARERVAGRGWENVAFVRGDAMSLPVDGPVDAVFASFLSGMLPAPADAVADWVETLAPDGRVALLDAARSHRRVAWPANQLVKAVVVASLPRKRQKWGEPPWATLDDRVEAAHGAVRALTDEWAHEEYALGVLRVTAGRLTR